MTDIAALKQEQELVTTNFSIEALLSQAVDKRLSVETIERLLAVRKELKAGFAKESYDKAMAKFQAQCPMIEKKKEVKNKAGALLYKYAPLEDIIEQAKPHLDNNDFSYSTQIIVGEKVKAICTAKHIQGHFETSEMEVPLSTKTDVMSNPQVIAATATFAKRYAFCNVFGIMTGDEDLDAQEDEEASLESYHKIIEDYKRKLEACKTLEELQTVWPNIPPQAKKELEIFKNELKKKYENPTV